ncbi:MAG: tetratricopeptide repeat protein [Candidatus Aminicenantes bacterium]|jgi:tetratricopeptide (TPR) repeat protein
MKYKTVVPAILLLIFLAISLPIHSNEDFLKKAQKSMDLLDYDQAIYYYKQALIEDPSKPEIRPRLGFCYFRTGKREEVVRVCLDELALYPGSLHARILLAYVYFHQGKIKEMVATCQDFNLSLEKYRINEVKKMGKAYKVKRGSQWRLTEENSAVLHTKILDRYSNLGLPYFMLGVYHKTNLNFDKASQNIQKALHWGYDPLECHIQLNDIELIQNNWEMAIQKARYAHSVVDSQAELYFLMGYSYYQMGYMDRAEACFSNAYELKPYVIETLKNLSKVYLATGNFEDAEKRLKQVMKVSTFDYSAQFLYDRARKKQRLPNPAQRLKLTKTLAERPSMKYKYTFETDITFVANLINSAAMTLLKKGLLDEAIVMTESFLEVYEAASVLNYNLGHFYNMKNDLDNALKFAWIAAELQEDFKDAYDLIGNIFLKMGDLESSIKAYRKVIAIDPKDAMSHYNLGCAFFAKGDMVRAEECWLNAIRNEKNKRAKNRDEISDDELSFSLVVVGRRVAFKSYESLGQLYKSQKLWDKALKQFQFALELEPNRSELHYEIGKVHMERGNISEAIQSFEKYVYFGGSKEEEVKRILDDLKSKKKGFDN